MNSKAESANPTLDTIKLVFSLLLVIAALVAFYIFADQSLLYRVIGLLLVAGVAIWISLQTEKGGQILGFFQEAQVEVRRVVWPTRQETLQTTLLVIIVVVLIAVILWLLDMLLGASVGWLMSPGN